MTPNAFKVILEPGQVTGYKQRYDEIRAEVASELRAAWILDCLIFLAEEKLTRFAMQKVR